MSRIEDRDGERCFVFEDVPEDTLLQFLRHAEFRRTALLYLYTDFRGWTGIDVVANKAGAPEHRGLLLARGNLPPEDRALTRVYSISYLWGLRNGHDVDLFSAVRIILYLSAIFPEDRPWPVPFDRVL